MKWRITFFLVVILSSCFLSKYKRTNFTYTDNSQSYEMSIIVPKGYTKEKTEVDSSGNTILSYFYKDNSFFYVAYLLDSNAQLQPIIEEENIPRMEHTTGAFIYKGMDTENLYWREIRRDGLRVGYHHVAKEQ